VANHSEKPLALLTQLIEAHSHPQELVLDLFSGSGSAACAALLSARNVLSLEKDEFQTIAIAARILTNCTISEEESVDEEVICFICKKGPAEELLLCNGSKCANLGH
jgi:DNA modification methylase